MRGSFVLGILGGVFGILVGLVVLVLAGTSEALSPWLGEDTRRIVGQLYVQTFVALLGGVLGIIGGAIGRKIGGVILMLASLFVLVGGGLFGILPFILLLVGGVLSFREAKHEIALSNAEGYGTVGRGKSNTHGLSCPRCSSTDMIKLDDEVYECWNCGLRFKNVREPSRGIFKWIAVSVMFFMLGAILGYGAGSAATTKTITNTVTVDVGVMNTQTIRDQTPGGGLRTVGLTESCQVSFSSRKFEFSILQYIRGKEADDEIQNANPFNPKPETGFEYVLIKIRLSHLSVQGSSDTISIGPYDFILYADGVGYKAEIFLVYPEDKKMLEFVDLFPGGRVEGWILFEVPEKTSLMLTFTPLSIKPQCFIRL